MAGIQDRLRNHPNQLDITDGDALNVLLDILLNPASAGRSLQTIKTRSDPRPFATSRSNKLPNA